MADAGPWERRDEGAGKLADPEPDARARGEPEPPSDLLQPGLAAELYTPDEGQFAERSLCAAVEPANAAERQLPVALDAPAAESQSLSLTAAAEAELPDAPESAAQVPRQPAESALLVAVARAAESLEPAVSVEVQPILARGLAWLA